MTATKVACFVAAIAMASCGQGRNAPASTEIAQPPVTQPEPSMPPPPQPAPADSAAAQPHGVAVYALSRGKGVPDQARAARDQARALMEQWRSEKRVLDIREMSMGLEGERRICATFASAEDAADAANRLRALGKGADLYNVVLEPCAKPGDPRPQGDKP